MWTFTSLDLSVGVVICLTVGFGLGVMYWEWMTKENEDAGIGSDVLDLSGDPLLSSVRSDMGLGRVGIANPSAGNQDRVDHSGVGGAVVPSENRASRAGGR